MRKEDISRGLTEGLTANFSGELEIEKKDRGGFAFNSVHLDSEDSKYHDEWFNGSLTGGQELLKVGNQMCTRQYAGGVVDHEVLQELGVTEVEVLAFLAKTLLSQREKTRLFEDCFPDAEHDWQYAYFVLDTDTSVDITMAKETITYKGKVVFVHSFLICPLA